MNQPPSRTDSQLSGQIDHNRFVGRTRVAYFSMEIAIAPEMPTYSGGLGTLAGDTARAAADLDLPIVFVTLVSRAGYLRQELDAAGLPGYDVILARKLVSGADLWLNTPQPPLEASGISGMKAALNGVPSLSVLDGWWVDGCIEGITGWAIGTEGAAPETHGKALFDKLESTVLPLFHRDLNGTRYEGRDQQGRCGLHLPSHNAPLCHSGLSELRGLMRRITDQLPVDWCTHLPGRF